MSLKCLFKGNLEDKRKHVERRQADVVAKGEYVQERVAVLSVLSQINHKIERSYSDDTEEDLDEQYNIMRQKILEFHEKIITKLKKRSIFIYYKELNLDICYLNIYTNKWL